MNEHIAQLLRPDLQTPICVERRALSRGWATPQPDETNPLETYGYVWQAPSWYLEAPNQ